MVKNNLIKIFAVLFIFLSVFFIVSPAFTYAKTSTYGNDDEFDPGEADKEEEGWLANTLLSLLAGLIFAVGWCIEKLGALLVFLLTGLKIFPWADRVIFNSVPLLDPNFINPSNNSLFMENNQLTTIGNVVRSTYFTGLSIGLGFFGIIVAVMAIRLAISSIAADKAKYKEAIVHWLTALVLLFALHYVLSGIFYINEQLVEVACTIVKNLMNNSGGNGKSVSDLGNFFKSNAFSGSGMDKMINSTIYAILVVQSLMFFYSYLKRLFFVLILAIISPFVVVYDFMKKAIA